MEQYSLYTIGYEGKSIDGFINHLKQSGISTLVDVREIPISRKKGFSMTVLSQDLYLISKILEMISKLLYIYINYIL